MKDNLLHLLTVVDGPGVAGDGEPLLPAGDVDHEASYDLTAPGLRNLLLGGDEGPRTDKSSSVTREFVAAEGVRWDTEEGELLVELDRVVKVRSPGSDHLPSPAQPVLQPEVLRPNHGEEPAVSLELHSGLRLDIRKPESLSHSQ